VNFDHGAAFDEAFAQLMRIDFDSIGLQFAGAAENLVFNRSPGKTLPPGASAIPGRPGDGFHFAR